MISERIKMIPSKVVHRETLSEFYLVVSGGINELVFLGPCIGASSVPICICEFKEELLVGFSSGLVRYFIWQKNRLVEQTVTYARDLNYMLVYDGFLYIFSSGEILRLSVTNRQSFAIDCRDVVYACAAFGNFFVFKYDGEIATVAVTPIFVLENTKESLFGAEKTEFTPLFEAQLECSQVSVMSALKRVESRFLLNSAVMTRVHDNLEWICNEDVYTFDLRSRKHITRHLVIKSGLLTETGEVVDLDGVNLRIYAKEDDYFNIIEVIDLSTDSTTQNLVEFSVANVSKSSSNTNDKDMSDQIFTPAGAGMFIANGQILSLRTNDALVDEFKSILRSSILTRSSETDELIVNFVSLSPEHLDTDEVILETLLRHLRNFVTSDVLKICSKCLENRLKSECYEIVINIMRTLRCYDYAKDMALIYEYIEKLLEIPAFGQSFYIQEIFKAALDKFGHLYLCLFDPKTQDDYTRVFEELAVFAGLKLKITLQNYRTFLDNNADYASMARACDSTLSFDNVYMKTISTLIDLLILSGRGKEATRVVQQINGIVPLLFVKIQEKHFGIGNIEIRHQPVDISAILKANNWFEQKTAAEQLREMIDKEIRTIEQINSCHAMLDTLPLEEKSIMLETIAVHPLVKISSFHQILFMEIFCQIQEEIHGFEPSEQQFELIQDVFANTNDQLQLFNILNKHNNVELIIEYALETGNYLSAIALLLRTNQETIGLYNGVYQILQMIKLDDVNIKNLGDNADELIQPIWILFKLVFERTVTSNDHTREQNLELLKEIFLQRDTILLKILRYVIMKTSNEEELDFIERLDLSQEFLDELWTQEAAQQ